MAHAQGSVKPAAIALVTALTLLIPGGSRTPPTPLLGRHGGYDSAVVAAPVPRLSWSPHFLGQGVTGLASQVGQWEGPLAWPLVAIHGIVLHTGEVLLIDDDLGGGGSARLWNPQTQLFTSVPNTFSNLYCAGHAVLADGRVLLVGGQDVPNFGIADTNIYDPVTRSWSLVKPMAFKRWYPTATTLADGRVLAVTGDQDGPYTSAAIPEIYDPASDNWSRLDNASLPLPNYPFMFVLPDGRVLQAGADEDDTPARVLDITAQTWTTIDPTVVPGGSAVMYQPGKVLKVGSSAYVGVDTAPAVNDAYVLDATAATPRWRTVGSMAFPRAHHNLTLLPDGDVLVTGGMRTPDGVDTNEAIYAAELWSPVTEQWTTMASMQTPRLYHSIALLLPDARVLVAGSGRWGPNQFSAELFSPPYLFKGSRPVIQSAPANVAYAGSFEVQTPDAARIRDVVLIRPGAVTHAFDMDQRRVNLSFVAMGTGVRAQAPANGNIAPPGYYMLFLVDSAGVPSVARFVRIGSGASGPQPTATPTSLPSLRPYAHVPVVTK